MTVKSWPPALVKPNSCCAASMAVSTRVGPSTRSTWRPSARSASDTAVLTAAVPPQMITSVALEASIAAAVASLSRSVSVR